MCIEQLLTSPLPRELFCIHGSRDTEILRKLIKACKNISEFDFEGLNLLHLASNSGQIEVVRELVNGGIDVNIQSRERLTTLCYAVSTGRTSIVELLLENGAKMENCCSASEHWMASLLSSVPNVAICRLLDDQGINDWTERTTCSFPSRFFVPHFTPTRKGDGLNPWLSCKVHQLTPLHHLAYLGYIDVVKYVVEYVKDVDIDIEAGSSIRPLFFAILSEQITVVRYLLEKGANPNGIYRPTRWTMLHLAAHIGSYEIVTSLLEHGAGR